MKRVSDLNLIGQRIEEMKHHQSKKGFLDMTVFQRKIHEWLGIQETVVVSLDIPYIDLVEGEHLCEEVKEFACNAIMQAVKDPKQQRKEMREVEKFQVDVLIKALYKDFLNHARTMDMDELYDRLTALKDKFDRIEQERQSKVRRIIMERHTEYRIILLKKYVLKGEFYLTKIAQRYPGFYLSLERLISLLYRDYCMERIQKESVMVLIHELMERLNK